MVPAVPAVAEPSVEILNQEAQNAGALSLHSGAGPQVAGDIQTDIQPRCEPSFVEECHNEYKMVCEETSIEREKEVCDTVLEEVCKTGVTTEYEPACFQRVINHCSNVCKRALDVSCKPNCEVSLAAPNCHKVKVVTPTKSCTKVPREKCGPKIITVPYEKCHDEPHKVCQKVEKSSCR